MASIALKPKKRGLLDRIQRQKWLLLMLAPAMLLTMLFCYAPLSGWVMAFTDYQIGKPLFGNAFTGLLQFKRLFLESSDLGYLLRNTLIINVTSVINNLLCALVLTILLRELRWKFGAKAVQTVTFFPYFVSMVIAYSIIWSLMSVNSGAINQFLVRAGILKKGINVLGDARYSWLLMILLALWKYTGYNCVIFLSTAAGIPMEHYEAASIDGAGRFQKVWYITLPGLLPTAAVLLIMNSGWILNSNLEQFFVFQNATNWETMEVLDMYIYKFGLKLLDYPYATAAGMAKTIVSLVMIVLVNRSVKALSGTGIF